MTDSAPSLRRNAARRCAAGDCRSAHARSASFLTGTTAAYRAVKQVGSRVLLHSIELRHVITMY
jgi:hypothetical protein